MTRPTSRIVLTISDRDQLARLIAGVAHSQRADRIAHGSKRRARQLVVIYDRLAPRRPAEVSPLWTGGARAYPTPAPDGDRTTQPTAKEQQA